MTAEERKALVAEVARLIHTDGPVPAALLLQKTLGLRRTREESLAFKALYELLQWCLDTDNYEDAAALLWGPALFTPKPLCTRMVWEAIRGSSTVLLMGASSMSKTYGCGVYFFLDWLRDPDYTTVRVVGPSEDHLQNNLFSHLVTLHRQSAIPLPGQVGDLYIGRDLRERKASISGVIVPMGKKAAGRLQGIKRFPRVEPHPLFGKLSRVRVLIDEIERVPVGLWSDIDNITSNVSKESGLKIVGAYNPSDITHPTAQRAEPVKLWGSLDPDKDHTWVSRRGWTVVRLDACLSENVKTGEELFPGLQTKEGLDLLRQQSGGEDTPNYQTFGRALYPVTGGTRTIITPTMLRDFKSRVLFEDIPRRYLAVDSALEGADAALAASGLWGLAKGVWLPPSATHPDGQEVLFTAPDGHPARRLVLYLDRMLTLPSGDTVSMTTSIHKLAKELGVEPHCVMLDRTGNGSGVHDLLKDRWGPEVRGLNYSESCSELKLAVEDSQVPKERFDRVHTEIWFAFRVWREFGIIFADPSIDMGELVVQFTGRQFIQRGPRMKIESKQDYKARNGGRSCNEADAVNLLIHCVRLDQQFQAAMDSTSAARQGRETGSLGEMWREPRREVDPTNRMDNIEDDSQDMSAGVRGPVFTRFGPTGRAEDYMD
jgi:hypothetical protein